MEPIIAEYREHYSGMQRYTQRDSGFATPELYDLFEDNDVSMPSVSRSTKGSFPWHGNRMKH